jgi:cell shape-determining protein MreC
MPEMPIYVRIEEYKDVLDVINMLKNKLKEAKESLNRINELKNEEDTELEKWESGLDAVQRKVEFIDKVMFEPEAV